MPYHPWPTVHYLLGGGELRRGIYTPVWRCYCRTAAGETAAGETPETPSKQRRWGGAPGLNVKSFTARYLHLAHF